MLDVTCECIFNLRFNRLFFEKVDRGKCMGNYETLVCYCTSVVVYGKVLNDELKYCGLCFVV